MRKTAVVISVFVLFLGWSAVAGASTVNLLANGDFETVDHTLGKVNHLYLDQMTSGQWDVFNTLPGGWYTGLNEAGIEVQYNTVVTAQSGHNYIELDSHPGPNSNSSMSQDVVFGGGGLLLQFYYRPRTATADDNGISVWFDGNLVTRLNGVTSSSNNWVLYSYNLGSFDAGTYTLAFAADGIENTLGGFIDSASLQAVPIPGAVWLLGSGLLGLVGIRRRSRKS